MLPKQTHDSLYHTAKLNIYEYFQILIKIIVTTLTILIYPSKKPFFPYL